MELEKGNKFIPPIAEVVHYNNDDSEVRLKFGEGTSAIFEMNELQGWRKVLGLVGDNGLKAEVGMKVTDLMWGDGEIINTRDNSSFPIEVKFAVHHFYYTRDGKWDRDANRTLYVTERASKELRGWAVYWPKRDPKYPTIWHLNLLTKKEAQDKFKEDFIDWIPKR
jgi:hypothetical protein